LAQFYGAQENYTEFSVPVQWLSPIGSPDTMVVLITSSTIFSQPFPGSTLTIDNISFAGATTPFPNGDFENWVTIASEEPDDWFTSNILSLSLGETAVSKTEDSYDGSYAVKIENTPTLFEDTLGIITNGTMGEDNPIGGMPVDSTPDKLTGYYKYIPAGPDTAIGGMLLYHYNQNTGFSELLEEAIIKLPPTEEYTYFEVGANYYSLPEPDTVNIAFASGNVIGDNNYVGLGSTLYLDALEITYKPNLVGIKDQPQDMAHRIFPNPTSDKLFLEFQEAPKNQLTVKVFNSKGLLVKEVNKNLDDRKEMEISTTHLLPGMYSYVVLSGNISTTGKFIVK
jgi:hypothetical protein